MTTEDLQARLGDVRERLDELLDSLNDVAEVTWDDVDQGEVVLALIRAQGELETARRLLESAVVQRRVRAVRDA
jgi:hypothetical protein